MLKRRFAILPGVILVRRIAPAQPRYPRRSRMPSASNTPTKSRSGYNYRFGKDIPSLRQPEVQGGGFIKPGAFPDATYCEHCHQQAYHQWRQALHSNSFRDAVLPHQRKSSQQDKRD